MHNCECSIMFIVNHELKHALRACISSIRGLRPLIIPQVGLRPTITIIITGLKAGLRRRNGLMSRGGLPGGAQSGVEADSGVGAH